MTTRPPKEESIRTWLRREAKREAKHGLLFLVAAFTVVFVLHLLWPNFAGHWARLNDRLARTAVHQNPLALLDTFSSRLHDSEYGWRLLAWSAPFNVTVARDGLRAEYPEIIGVFDGKPVVPRADSLRRLDVQRFNARQAAFFERYMQIEAYRFTWLYGEEDTFSVPDQSAALGQLATKAIGLPDAVLFTFRSIIAAGPVSIVVFSTLLALAGLALWQAPRPGRWWLKLLALPVLASTLVWLAVFPMALVAAILGRWTPNSSAFVFVALLPLLLLAARLVLRAVAHVFRHVPSGASPTVIIQSIAPAAKPAPPPPAAATADFPAPPPTPPPLRSGPTRSP
ncbi:MAG TPA: hypothetical protein VEB66_00470 [Opitutaceae bacterium]|nr:hypothetical protein [Opitutaceae bacterium]